MQQGQQQSRPEEELPHLLDGVNYSGCPGGEQMQRFPQLKHLFGRNQLFTWQQLSSLNKGRSAQQKEEPVLLVTKASQLLLEVLQFAQSRVQPFYATSLITNYVQGLLGAPAILS